MKHEKHRPARRDVAIEVARKLQQSEMVRLDPRQVRLFRDPMYEAQMLQRLRERVERRLKMPVEVIPTYGKRFLRGNILTNLSVRRRAPITPA